MNKLITVTQPCLPPLEEFIPYLQQIWDNKWLTNNGPLHQQLEDELVDFEPYRYLPSATQENLPVATKIAQQVLCLPIYVELESSDIERIIQIITV